MKQFIILLLAGLPTYLLCQDNIDLFTETILSGHIEHHDGTVLKIYDVMGKAKWEDVIPVNHDKFSMNLALNDPAIKMLIYGNLRKDIFLHPGKSLEVSFDTKDIENTFRYGGDLEKENSILDSISGRLNNIDYDYIYTQPLDRTTHYLDSLQTNCREFLRSLLDTYKTLAIFEKYAIASIDHKVAYLKILLGERQDEQYAGYYDFLDEINLEDANLLDIPDYRIFLYFYLEKETSKRYKELDSVQQRLPDATLHETLQVIEEIKNVDIRSYCLYNAMIGRLMEQGINGFDEHYQYFNEHNTDANYTEQMKLAYEEKKRIAPGQPAPPFKLVDLDGNHRSLEDFNGKYVYIDFWLTTCPRSARELPHFLDLYADYHEDNIVFVSISPDRDKQTWMNYVKEKRNVGISLWSDKFLDSEVFNDYQVNGTPSYVLIDPDGKIIDPVAPKPSSTEIRTILDKLLERQ